MRVGSSNLGLSINGRLECEGPFFINVRMSDTRIVDYHAATTRLYEGFHTSSIFSVPSKLIFHTSCSSRRLNRSAKSGTIPALWTTISGFTVSNALLNASDEVIYTCMHLVLSGGMCSDRWGTLVDDIDDKVWVFFCKSPHYARAYKANVTREGGFLCCVGHCGGRLSVSNMGEGLMWRKVRPARQNCCAASQL